MTTGQRIAAKRKENNLSQEALGERLGVSRQSIYKWESDASLPEVEKLVALSRLFEVPVGWLLGVEEDAAFSREQLKLVEELLRRCQAEGEEGRREQMEAQVEAAVAARLAEAPPVKKRRRTGLALLAAGAALLCVLNLFQRLDNLQMQYNTLSNTLGQITGDVDAQIGAIAGRVEAVLKAQNGLTADYGAEPVSLDPAANTATFALRVVPRTYTPDLTVVFQADSGGVLTEIPAAEGPERTFTAALTCPLDDSITLSAVFTTGGVSQTQLLEAYSGLYSLTLPGVSLDYGSPLLRTYAQPGRPYTFHWDELYVNTQPERYDAFYYGDYYGDLTFQPAEAAAIEVGLFVNQRPAAWFTPCEKPDNFDGFDGQDFYILRDFTLELAEGDHVCVAALVTDEHGRQFVRPALPEVTPVDGRLEHTDQKYYSQSWNPADWGI